MLAPDPRTRRFLDVIVGIWILLWLVVGYVVHSEVLGLRKLSDTVVVVGRNLDATSAQLKSLGNLPLVGAELETAAGNAHRAAVSARFSGRESRTSVVHLANWLWFAISAIAILPILLLYGVLRFGPP